MQNWLWEVFSSIVLTVHDTTPIFHGITQRNANKNLGIKTFLNGKLVSDIIIDTSEVATDTIDYVVTDSSGLAATSTRTVIIEATTAPETSAGSLIPDATGSSPVVEAPPLVPDYSTTAPIDQVAATSITQ